MRQSIKTRLEKLEAARRPPEPVWTIGIDWVVGWRDGGSGGRVVAHTPPRLIEPGEGFNWQRGLDEIAWAHEQMSGIEDDWADDLIDEEEDNE